MQTIAISVVVPVVIVQLTINKQHTDNGDAVLYACSCAAQEGLNTDTAHVNTQQSIALCAHVIQQCKLTSNQCHSARKVCMYDAACALARGTWRVRLVSADFVSQLTLCGCIAVSWCRLFDRCQPHFERKLFQR
jgi:hypothetical protein